MVLQKQNERPRIESRQHPTSHPCLGAATPHHWKSKRERRVFKTSCLPPVGLFVHDKSKKQSPLRNERTCSKRSKIKETLYWTFVALELDLEFRALSSRFQAAFLAVAEKTVQHGINYNKRIVRLGKSFHVTVISSSMCFSVPEIHVLSQDLAKASSKLSKLN